MAKVLFVNPVVREEDDPRHVPYGIALIAAIAMRRGHLVQIYDANAWRQTDDVLEQVFEADDWQVIALGGITTSYGSIKNIVRLAREARPEAVIVLGGGVMTSLPREMLAWLAEVDVGVIGEAFETFVEILEMVDAGGRDWQRIKGTISRREDGEPVFSEQRQLIEDLDSLPYPAWELFPLEEVYFRNSPIPVSEEGILTRRRIDINASYGCSLICRFCHHLGIAGDMRYVTNKDGATEVEFDVPGTYTRQVRYHSPEYVVRLAKHAHDSFGVDFIAFLDENLMTMDRSSGGVWLAEICRLWKAYGLAPKAQPTGDGTRGPWSGVYWSGTSHATLVNTELLKTMREAGCSYLIYGYESFSPHIMKIMGKGATPKTNMRSFFATLAAGIRPVPNQIIGFPNEDFVSIRQNMDAWETLGIVVKPHIATPYPGSEWFAVYRKSIEEQYDGDLEAFVLDLGDATKVTATISHNFNAVELVGLREMMVNLDYSHINKYEEQWRRNHGIPEDAPSTLYRDPAALKLAG